MTLGENDLPEILDDPIFDPINSTREDTPPLSEKRGRGRPRKPDSAPKKSALPKASWPKAGGVAKSLTVTFEGIVLGVGLLNVNDSQAIEAGAPDLIQALIDLGTTDTRYRRYLEAMATPGKFGPLIIASSAIILPIAANHGLFNMFNKPTPDTINPNLVDQGLTQ